MPKVKKVFIGSGIRHDLVLEDQTYGLQYLEEIIRHHISGQLKIAPEHSEDHILALMGKTLHWALYGILSPFSKDQPQDGKKTVLNLLFYRCLSGMYAPRHGAFKPFQPQGPQV